MAFADAFSFGQWRRYTEDYPSFLRGTGKLLTLKKLWTPTIQGPEYFLLLKRYAKKGLKKSRYPVANLRLTHADGFFTGLPPTRGPGFLLRSTRFATDLACKCVGGRKKKKKNVWSRVKPFRFFCFVGKSARKATRISSLKGILS